MLLWSWLGFLCVLWIAKLQRDFEDARRARRQRLRAQLLGLAPIRGNDGARYTRPGES